MIPRQLRFRWIESLPHHKLRHHFQDSRGQFRSNSKVMEEIVCHEFDNLFQHSSAPKDMKRFLKSQSAIHCMLNRLDLLFLRHGIANMCRIVHLPLVDSVMCPTPVRRLQKRPSVISRMRRLFSDVQIVEWNIKPQSSHLYVVFWVLLSQFKFLVSNFNVRSVYHSYESLTHSLTFSNTYTHSRKQVRSSRDGLDRMVEFM